MFTNIFLNFFFHIGKEVLILSDSMTKDFPVFRNKEVVTIRGATTPKMVAFVNKNHHFIKKFKVIVLHVGTNYFSKKHEWLLYMDYVNRKCTKEVYDCKLQDMNPPCSRDSHRLQRELPILN